MTDPGALAVVREEVPGSCPRCAAADLRSYPVLGEGGWFLAVKCQQCLFSVRRDRWGLLGPVQLTSTGLALD